MGKSAFFKFHLLQSLTHTYRRWISSAYVLLRYLLYSSQRKATSGSVIDQDRFYHNETTALSFIRGVLRVTRKSNNVFGVLRRGPLASFNGPHSVK